MEVACCERFCMWWGIRMCGVKETVSRVYWTRWVCVWVLHLHWTTIKGSIDTDVLILCPMHTSWADRVEDRLYSSVVAAARGTAQDMRMEKLVSTCVCCWRREEVVRCVLTDVFDIFRGACIVSKWVAGKLLTGMAGAVGGRTWGLERKR